MTSRREDLLDAAIAVLGESGIRGLTHRAVDAAAGLPPGSASNYFRTSDALLEGVVERFVVREQANWEELAGRLQPTTPTELAAALAVFVRESTDVNRSLTLARYAILVEAAQRPSLRAALTEGGARVRTWVGDWLGGSGAPGPDRHLPVLMNYVAGLVLHQLANPDPDFDPTDELAMLVGALVRPDATPATTPSPA